MAGSIRLFVPADLHEDGDIPLSAEQAHYLTRVMRREAGAEVLAFNGRDGEWRGRIERVGKSQVRLALEHRTRPQAAASDTWLLVPPLRRERGEWLVEKATELGVARIALVATARTNPGRLNLDRMRAIAVEAAEQSERLDVPAIDPVRSLSDVLGDWPVPRRLVAAVERRQAGPLLAADGPSALLVGPEGGFDRAELDALARNPLVSTASLGPRILRAETAALVGLVLLTRASG